MSFITHLPGQPSLGELLAGGIGSGLATGLERGAQQRSQLGLMEKQSQLKQQLQQDKMHQALSLYQMLTGKEPLTKPSIGESISDQGIVEREPVQQAVPEEERFPSQEAVATMMAVDPNLGRAAMAERQAGLKRTQDERKLALQETKDVRKEYAEKSRKAKDFDLRLDRMDELVKEGKLISPFFNAFLEKAGLDIPALKNPQSQEFDKLVSDLTRDIRSRFGARITNFELRIFLKSIPGLSQTDSGKKRVIENLRLLNEADIVRNDAKKEVIRRHGGTPPIDLEDQVEETADAKLNDIADKFKGGLEGKKKETAETGKVLDLKMARKILEKAGGDKAKARQMAERAGFQF